MSWPTTDRQHMRVNHVEECEDGAAAARCCEGDERFSFHAAPERDGERRQSPTKCGSSVISISSMGAAAIRSSDSWLTGMNERRWCAQGPCICSSCMCAGVE